MRLSGRDVQPEIKVSPETVRPIRLRLAGFVFTMHPTEAMDLANQLADAVAELKPPRALEIFNTESKPPKALEIFNTGKEPS
ncbi:hypothetical protein ACORG1_24650 [Mycobacterium sp. TJFP1]|uniref:hypothetical protein n=1 Tax=Mycolicibacterium austroafricanum TaxID=39687 RepID=UPI000CFA44C5|nr:hypothetical protein [Mycolicibacterium austroafricanum]PQP38792.1 hypothetical protein C6A88_34825 [Mycolicibacterium austroafricanum]